MMIHIVKKIVVCLSLNVNIYYALESYSFLCSTANGVKTFISYFERYFQVVP
jgi:hypothetical protein